MGMLTLEIPCDRFRMVSIWNAETPAKCQSDTICIIPNLVASSLHEILRYRGQESTWRHLHCSEITACVLYGLIPSFCSLISRFWPGSYLRFELPVNRYRRNCLSIPNVIGCFCPNCSGSSVSKAIHSHDKVRQPCLYFKDSEGVFSTSIIESIQCSNMTKIIEKVASIQLVEIILLTVISSRIDYT